MQPEPKSNKTFRELLDTFNDDDVIMKAKVLTKCLYENTEDKPSTKDILDAVKKMETAPKSGLANTSYSMSILIEAYLQNKKIMPMPEQFVNPFETLQNLVAYPAESFQGIVRNVEGSILGLSQESKFVTDIIEKITNHLDKNFQEPVHEINETKKKY